MAKKCDMDDPLIQFIRDRFKSLEDNMTSEFNDVRAAMYESKKAVNDRFTILENEKYERKGAMTVWGLVCTTVASGVAGLVTFFLGKH